MESVINYYLFEDITSDTIRHFAEFMQKLPPQSKVALYVGSYGGSVFDGIGITSMIRVCQNAGIHFTAYVYGLAASSAADIVLACDRIEMASTSSIMIHSSFNDSGKVDEGIRVANQVQLEIIHKRLPNYSKEDLKVDRWFRADEALSIGLCDALFDVDENDQVARVAAKYIESHNGGVQMDEEVKVEATTAVVEAKAEDEEVKEDVREEVREEEEEVDYASILEAMLKRMAEMDERIKELEGKSKAECGDREKRDNARLKAVYDRINAVCAPVSAKKSEDVEKGETPEETLARHKATYKNLNFYIRQD